MTVYPVTTVTPGPAELNEIVAGFAKLASTRAVEQSTGSWVTVIESFVKTEGPTEIVHSKQNVSV